MKSVSTQSECRKIQTRKTPNTNTCYAVRICFFPFMLYISLRYQGSGHFVALWCVIQPPSAKIKCLKFMHFKKGEKQLSLIQEWNDQMYEKFLFRILEFYFQWY